MHNNTYNITRQLVEENTSLWRIQNEYLKDAEGNAELTAFWNKLAEDKKQHIADLQALLKKELA